MGQPLQLDVADNPRIPRTVTLHFCSPHQLVYAYDAHGAGTATGLVLPRSTLAVDVTVGGKAGDPFVVDATFNAVAVAATATGALVALTLLPSGTEVVKNLIHDGVLDPDILTLITDTARSCESSLNAAINSTNAGLWAGAVSCWSNQGDFVEAIADIYVKVAVAHGIANAADAAKLTPVVKAILVGQAFNQILAEMILFGVPHDISFPYLLRCDLQDNLTCPAGGATSGTPSPSPTPTSPQAGISPTVARVDWRNTTYTLSCDGLAPPFKAVLRGGAATVSGNGESYNVRYEADASGDVTGDGLPETAVRLWCSPQPSNFFVEEVQVFTHGKILLGKLPNGESLRGNAPLPPVYVPTELRIVGGEIRAGMMFYGPNDSHASGPTVHRTLVWRWNGKALVKV